MKILRHVSFITILTYLGFGCAGNGYGGAGGGSGLSHTGLNALAIMDENNAVDPVLDELGSPFMRRLGLMNDRGQIKFGIKEAGIYLGYLHEDIDSVGSIREHIASRIDQLLEEATQKLGEGI